MIGSGALVGEILHIGNGPNMVLKHITSQWRLACCQLLHKALDC